VKREIVRGVEYKLKWGSERERREEKRREERRDKKRRDEKRRAEQRRREKRSPNKHPVGPLARLKMKKK
jgi:hypothetical protein